MIALTTAWFQLRPHLVQSRLYYSNNRFNVVVAGRVSGKTTLARRRVISYLRVKKPWTDARYFYALPTYAQANLVAWEQLKSLVPKHWLRKEPNDSKMIIETKWGSRLYCVGLDKPARIEGVEWDGGIVDESSDQKPGSFDRSIAPALAARKGWCWRIGAPKRFGPGAREFRNAYELGLRGEAEYQSFSWPSTDILPADEVQRMREQLDSKDFAEFNGSWVDAGGAAYYEFSETESVKACAYNPDRMLYVGSDFNVNPMAWVLGQVVETPYGQGLEIFDELWYRDTNTREVLNKLWAKYSSHKGGWCFIGDATGRARKTAASVSDYRQIQNDERFRARVRYPKSNPEIKDRLASVNMMLRNAAGHRKLHVDRSCRHLIDDLKTRALAPDGTLAPETGQKGRERRDSGHASDALGYLVHKLFPITLQIHDGRKLIVLAT